MNFKLDLQYITKYFNCKCVFLFSGSQTLPLVHFQKEYMHSVDGKIGIPKAETQKSALKYGVPSTGSPLKFHGLFLFCVHFDHFHCRKASKKIFLMKEHVLKGLLQTIVLVILRKPAIPHHAKSLHLPKLLIHASSQSAMLYGNASSLRGLNKPYSSHTSEDMLNYLLVVKQLILVACWGMHFLNNRNVLLGENHSVILLIGTDINYTLIHTVQDPTAKIQIRK